ncbi:FCD domain-containing protein [uncultured Roseibium sp.]|uniref:GntR family transcriptional regulator n=1 Tax=uncultured Roseibium sp. TaxID=1936171 RepID=UPI0026076FE9|nr:FCD domain-containing protein [uncultured Roseibium sp.]
MGGKNSIISTLVDELRRDISLGVLEPGQKLQIEAIRSKYGGVSAPSVREALSTLAGEKYVSGVDQRGFFVAKVSVEELADLTRVRAELERLALLWSIDRSDRAWRAYVVAKHHILREVEGEFSTSMAASILDWDEANKEFHLALTRNCGSPSLIELIKNQYDLTRRYRLMAYSKIVESKRRMDWLERSIVEHEAIKESVLESRSEVAGNALVDHITKAQSDLEASR